jgi:hypothetical protein
MIECVRLPMHDGRARLDGTKKWLWCGKDAMTQSKNIMATQPKTEEEAAWLYSSVKEQLFQDVRNGNGLLTTPAKVVWQSREMYSKMPYQLFSSRYYALRGRAQDKNIVAKEEEKLLDHCMQSKVYNLARPDGAEPYWDGSKAQMLLTEDLKCDEKYNMKPRVLRLTREEYQLFNQDSFRQYFNQEKRTIKLKLSYSKKKKQRAGI